MQSRRVYLDNDPTQRIAMTLQFPSLPQNSELQQEAIEILIQQMGIAKAAIFISDTFWQPTDYLEIKERLFEGETVASLYAKIQAFPSPNKTVPISTT